MSLTYADSLATAADAAAARRKSVTVGLMIVLHAVMFYGFTHGMKIRPLLASTDMTLVTVKALPIAEPQPRFNPDIPKLPTDQVVVDLQMPDQMPFIEVQPTADVTPTFKDVGNDNQGADAHGSGP
jgi:hypothetical protein